MNTQTVIEAISKLLTRSKEYGVIRMTSEEKKALNEAIKLIGEKK